LVGGLCLCANAFGQIGESLEDLRTVFGDVVPAVAKGSEVRFKTTEGIEVLARFRQGRVWQVHFRGVMSEQESLKLLQLSHPRWKEFSSNFDSTSWKSDDERLRAFYLLKSKHLIVDLAQPSPKKRK